MGVQQEWRRSLENNRNLAVAQYLMASYLYYLKNVSIVSDLYFDWLCTFLAEHWDEINHPHKHLISYPELAAGTGFYLKEEDLPGITKSSAERIAKAHGLWPEEE